MEWWCEGSVSWVVYYGEREEGVVGWVYGGDVGVFEEGFGVFVWWVRYW